VRKKIVYWLHVKGARAESAISVSFSSACELGFLPGVTIGGLPSLSAEARVRRPHWEFYKVKRHGSLHSSIHPNAGPKSSMVVREVLD